MTAVAQEFTGLYGIKYTVSHELTGAIGISRIVGTFVGNVPYGLRLEFTGTYGASSLLQTEYEGLYAIKDTYYVSSIEFEGLLNAASVSAEYEGVLGLRAAVVQEFEGLFGLKTDVSNEVTGSFDINGSSIRRCIH